MSRFKQKLFSWFIYNVVEVKVRYTSFDLATSFWNSTCRICVMNHVTKDFLQWWSTTGVRQFSDFSVVSNSRNPAGCFKNGCWNWTKIEVIVWLVRQGQFWCIWFRLVRRKLIWLKNQKPISRFLSLVTCNQSLTCNLFESQLLISRVIALCTIKNIRPAEAKRFDAGFVSSISTGSHLTGDVSHLLKEPKFLLKIIMCITRDWLPCLDL